MSYIHTDHTCHACHTYMSYVHTPGAWRRFGRVSRFFMLVQVGTPVGNISCTCNSVCILSSCLCRLVSHPRDQSDDSFRNGVPALLSISSFSVLSSAFGVAGEIFLASTTTSFAADVDRHDCDGAQTSAGHDQDDNKYNYHKAACLREEVVEETSCRLTTTCGSGRIRSCVV